MAASPTQLSIRRDGARLVVEGTLGFASVRAGFGQLPPSLAGVETIDLAAVTHADSAGLALLVECLRRAGPRKPAFDSPPPQLVALAGAMALSTLFAAAGG